MRNDVSLAEATCRVPRSQLFGVHVPHTHVHESTPVESTAVESTAVESSARDGRHGQPRLRGVHVAL